MPEFTFDDIPIEQSVNKRVINAIGLQLEALREAADFAVSQTYLTYAEDYYLGAHGAWVDLKKKPTDPDASFRARVQARLRPERNTLNAIKNVVSGYTEDFTVQDMDSPSCSFTLGVSQLGSTARLFRYDQIIKGILVVVPDTMTVLDMRSLLGDLNDAKEGGARIYILQEGKGIVLGSDGTLIGVTLNADLPAGSTIETGFQDPTLDFTLYPNVVNATGTIVGSTLNQTNSLFGMGVDSSEIIP